MDNDFDALLGDEPVAVLPEMTSTGALAALLGVTPRSVTELSRKGVLSPAGRGSWPVRDSVRAYCAHLREQAAGRSSDTNLTAERIRVAQAQAEKLELANSAARGELVPAKQVQSTWAGVLRDVRAALLAVSSRCGARLPHLTAHDVATIDIEIRSALEAIADGK